MPKNADGTRSRMRLKSTRKPFRDASNFKTEIKSAGIHRKISEENGGQAGDDSLDRLLLVHSDLSSLLRQIDELVVQALQSTSDNGRKEIKQFADVLSDMQTSLKPWVSRFLKAVASQPTVQENKPKQPEEKNAFSVSTETTTTAIESPQETKWESLVSPSPLVSWRAGCNTGNGRQLFLLTPLPQKKDFSSKYLASIAAVEKIPVRNLGDDVKEGVSAKPTPKLSFDKGVAKSAVDNLQTGCSSPQNVPNMNSSLVIMTPCMKMSPPKSCILLEPISAFSKKKSQPVHKSTSFPIGAHCFSESDNSDESSDGLKLKYPELYGIKKENIQKKMDSEDSPSWIVSPPKTCVVMNPSNQPMLNCLPLKTTAVSNKEGDFSTINTKGCQGVIRTLDLADFTPMMKEPVSNFRVGKHPGENTLKKELWTRFEAASSHGVCLQNNNKKGFLDILDEASGA